MNRLQQVKFCIALSLFSDRRILKRSNVRVLVKDATGHICSTPAAAQQRWIEFFQQIEGGQRLTHAEFRQSWPDHG
jgi:hypothetical protein